MNTDATETPGLTTGPVYVVSNSGAKHYDLETPEKNVWTNNGATQVLRGQGVTTYQVIVRVEEPAGLPLVPRRESSRAPRPTFPSAPSTTRSP